LGPQSHIEFKRDRFARNFRINQLKEGAWEKIEQLKLEYSTIDDELKYVTDSGARAALEERKRKLKTICESAKALEEIDRDLITFSGHLEGDDDRLKELAESFSKEFLQCKSDMEDQLNKML
jgi:hypothetical protein